MNSVLRALNRRCKPAADWWLTKAEARLWWVSFGGDCVSSISTQLVLAEVTQSTRVLFEIPQPL